MPMTLRTLKKKSKQSLAIMREHYPQDIHGLFLAERGENYHGHVIRCTHGSGDPCRVEGRPHCECSSHPLPGTPMFGGMSCGESPEWSESTALSHLQDAVIWGGRPTTATDKQWRRILAVTGVRPLTEVELAEMARG